MKTDANYNQDELWNRIKTHEIFTKHSKYGFENRLVFENNWSRKFCVEVIEEYKRFI